MLIGRAGELEQIDVVADLWEATRAALSDEGIDYVIYLTVDADRSAPFVLTNVPQIYDQTDPRTDPFLTHCCNSYAVTATGPEFLSQHGYLGETARNFIGAAADQSGFRSGLGIPMRLRGSDRFGGFNLGTGLDAATFTARIMPRAEEFRLFCLLVHRRIEELSRATPPAPGDFRDLLVAPVSPAAQGLSPREQEVIYLVARGISRKECARLCGISPNTVAEYTKSAYRKLGVQNRAEAAQRLMAGNS